MKQITWIVLSWLVLCATAQAASFDCAKASTKIEKLICGDAELSKLDEDLNKTYLRQLGQSAVKQQAIKNQRQWLKEVRNACQSAECLRNAYAARIKELGWTSSSTMASEKSPEKQAAVQPVANFKASSPLSACRAVADAANHKKLNELIVPFPEAKHIDINNDGLKERVAVIDEGTMHWQHFEAFSDNGKPIALKKSIEDDWESENLRFALDPSLIKYNGQIYILGKTDEDLNYLSQVNKDNLEKVVCEFARRSTPIETLITSKNDKLCQLALKQELDYVDFNQTSELTYENIRDMGGYPGTSTTPTDLAAQVDINNDGKPELVVGLEMMSGAGRGCNGEQLGVLNNERNNLDETITQQLPEAILCGGTKQYPFVFEGQAYIEIMYPLEHPINVHQVVQLKQGKLETVCQFDVRVVHYVVGE